MDQRPDHLRAAAASARAFADNLGSQDLRESFLLLARRWEAEAEGRDGKKSGQSGTSRLMRTFPRKAPPPRVN
jgi:hypothetical protein